jgi:hypothetical protein
MPLYRITAPNGQTYQIEGPEGASDAEVADAVMAQHPESGQAAPKQAPFSLKDTAVSAGQSALGATKSIAEAFGAGNAPAEYLEGLQKGLGTYLSPERQAEQQRRAEMEKAAAKSGSTLNEVGTYLGGVKEAPIQTIAQGVGSMAPTVLLGMGAAAAGAALGAPLLLAGGVGLGVKWLMGALQGAGEVKGSVYDAVREGLEHQGLSPDQAKNRAREAQNYIGENWGTIAAGAGLGGIAAGTGAEQALLSKFSKPVAAKIAAQMGEEAALKEAGKGTIRKYGEAALKEAIPEGAQGGQGQYAENVAMTRAGMATPAMQGVLGATARDAAVGALAGAAVHPFTGSETPQKTPPPPAPQPGPQLAPEVPPAAPTTRAEYADLAKELAQLRSEEQTPEVKARAALVADLLKDQDITAIEGQRKQTTQEAADAEKAKESAFVTPGQTQMEMREALPKGPTPQPTDLFGNPLAAAPDEAAPRVGDLYGGTNMSTEDLRDAGLAPSPQALETAGQQQLNLSGAFTPEDIKALGVPIGPGVATWVAKNVVGKTQEEVQALVNKTPTLVTQKGERAKVLKELLAPQPAKFEEAPNVQTLTAPTTAQQRNQPRAGEPSVGVPSQPAAPIASESVPGVPRATGAPAAPVGRGLVSTGQPVSKGNAPQAVQPTAVAQETPQEEAARKAEAEAMRKAMEAPPKRLAPKAAAPAPAPAPAPVTRTAPAESENKPFDITAEYDALGAKNPFEAVALYKKRSAEANQGRESAATTAKGQSLAELNRSIAAAKGPLGYALRRLVKSGKVKIEEKHPSGRPVGGYYDGSTVTLYADGIPEGKLLPVALHEVAAHMGLAKMLGKEMYNNVGQQIMNWVEKKDGSFEATMAQRAFKRIPIRDMKRGPEVFQDELVAYFIEEMAIAEAKGELPKVGALRTLWNRIRAALAKAVGKELKTDINPTELTPEGIYAMAQTAFENESKTDPVKGEVKEQFSISVSNADLIKGAGPLSPVEKGMLPRMLDGAKAVPTGLSRTTMFRTQTADIAATLEHRLREKFDGAVRNSLGEINPMGLYRQAQDYTKMLLDFFQQGSLVKDPTDRKSVV